MAIPTYLAMTAAEYEGCDALPSNLAWMACHFSPYATGLSNFPVNLPEGSMVIVNDIMPIQKHDPCTIVDQMTSLLRQQRCSAVLLDFQRPVNDNTRAIVQLLCEALPCPTGVPALLAKGLDCPVFLPPCPPQCPLETYIAPWQGKELWLEISLNQSEIQITENGVTYLSHHEGNCSDPVFRDDRLLCHYHTKIDTGKVTFSLWRDQEDLRMLLERGEEYGITRAVGLFQELKGIL